MINSQTIKCEVKDFGRQGPKGDAGVDGKNVYYGAPYDTLELLREAVPIGKRGELHVIANLEVYGWDETLQNWIYVGPWAGAQMAPDMQEFVTNLVATLSASSLAVGSVVASASIKELPGQKWLNGQTLNNAAANYRELLEYVLNNAKYVTLEEYSARLETDGQCAVYGWDGSALRLPLINRPIAGEYGDGIGQINKDTVRQIPAFKLPGSDNSDGGTAWESGPATTEGENDVRTLGFDSAAHGRPIKVDFSLLGPEFSGAETRGKQVLWPYSVVYTAKIQQNQSVPNYIYRANDQSATADTIAISIGGGFQTLPNNTLLLIKIKNTNTGPANIVINNGAPIPIQVNGSTLSSGDISAGNTYGFIFNQSLNAFDFMLNVSATGGDGGLSERVQALEDKIAALEANTKIIAGDNVTIEEISQRTEDK